MSRWKVFTRVNGKLRVRNNNKSLSYKAAQKLAKRLRRSKKGKTTVIRPVPLEGLTIVPRERWAAAPYNGTPTPRGSSRIGRIHHTAGPQPKNHFASEAKLMRDTQAFHQKTRGYADIGYHFVIMPSGKVFEGRELVFRGAHTLNHNDDIGICFAGDYTSKVLTRDQQDSYHGLCAKLGITEVAPHRATFETACPGNNIVRQLKL